MMALVAALTQHDTKGQVQRLLDTTLGNKPDDFSTLYLHPLFKQVPHIDGLSAEDEAVFSFLPDMQRSSACGLQHWEIGMVSRKDFTARSIFLNSRYPRWSLLVFFFSSP